MKRNIIIFFEVLILVLVVGFGAMFAYMTVTDKNIMNSNKKKQDANDKVVALIEELNEERTTAQDSMGEGDSDVEQVGRYDDLLSNPDVLRENKIYPVESASEDVIKLLFAGDVGFADGYAILGNIKARGGNIESAFDAETLDFMRSADIFMINNEFTFTDRGVPIEEKTYTFRCSPEFSRFYKDMGVDIVSLANNHVYDFGEVSLTDTIDTLNNCNVAFVGAGLNRTEAMKPAYYIVNDTCISIVSATQIERVDRPDTKGATDTTPGTFRCWYDDTVLEVIKEAKAHSDYCIAYIHWGTELEEVPDWAQLELAPKLAEAGADAIIGDHPHILQRIDYIGDTPVIYSLGNYLFNSKTLDTGLMELNINMGDGSLHARFVPCIQSACRTCLATGTEKARILSYLSSISPGVYIDEEGWITKR
ncbi:MAG: CapA family protein [Lachnospiraceae bacterium]|nr:CapA family protein [Lachnospiraceae bacterium]